MDEMGNGGSTREAIAALLAGGGGGMSPEAMQALITRQQMGGALSQGEMQAANGAGADPGGMVPGVGGAAMGANGTLSELDRANAMRARGMQAMQNPMASQQDPTMIGKGGYVPPQYVR